MKKSLLISLVALASLYAEVFVYGPGGPAPVLKKLAEQFNATSTEKIVIQAGPAPSWMEEAKDKADLIFSGNSSMMDTFAISLNGKIDPSQIQVLNIRQAGIIVRPNNPQKITNFKDLLKPGVKVMIVNGAGQVGLYEDMALKNGERANLIALRKNIQVFAKNSKQALELWDQDQSIDALIIWKHWAKTMGEKKAQFISLDQNSVIYRASEIVITNDSKKKDIAQRFINFLQSKEAQKVWEELGWIAD